MNTPSLLHPLTAYLLAALLGTTFIAAQPASPPSKPTPEQIEMMKKLMGPGKEHRRLDSWVGDWDVEIKLWNPGQKQPLVMKSKATRKWTKGGFFLEETRVGDTFGYEKAESTHVYGFNKNAQEYQAILFGEGVTSMFVYEGKFDDEKNKIVLEGDWIAPGAKVFERMEIEEPKNGKQVMTVYSWGEHRGKKIPEWIHLVLTYTKIETE